MYRPAALPTVIVRSDQRRGHVYNGLPPVDWNDCGRAACGGGVERRAVTRTHGRHTCVQVYGGRPQQVPHSLAPLASYLTEVRKSGWTCSFVYQWQRYRNTVCVVSFASFFCCFMHLVLFNFTWSVQETFLQFRSSMWKK